MQLKGKIALVTGAAKRVGKALALALAAQGVHIIVHYGRSEAEARQTAAEIEALGVRAWLHSADLGDEAQMLGVVPAALSLAGGLDILVNSASIFPPERFDEVTPQSWERNMRINLKAPFFLSQAFAQSLNEGQAGTIINLIDAVAMRPQTHHFSYAISKRGLEALTENMALALAPHHIRVNAIALGAILPAVNDNPDKFTRMAAGIPLRHTGNPQQVVDAMLYLLRADFVTGEVIRVDGGRHLI